MRKCILYDFVIAALLCCILAVGVSAADEVVSGTCGDNLTWVLDSEGTLMISGEGEMYDYAYRESPWWDSSHQKIKKVIVDENVTSIGKNAFRGCYNLSAVEFSDKLAYIGDYAFESCEKLIIEAFPEGLTEIGDYAFDDCEINTVIFANNNMAQSSGFRHTNIKKIIFENAVTEFEDTLLFKDSLVEIYVRDTDGNGLVSIDNVLYEYDAYLETYTLLRYIPSKSETFYSIIDGTETINEYAFSNCDNLEQINIADSVRYVDMDAFIGCDNLQTIIWGKSIADVHISTSSIFDNSPVTKIILPDDFKLIPNTKTLIEYEVMDSDGVGYRDIDGVLFYYDDETDDLTLKKISVW